MASRGGAGRVSSVGETAEPRAAAPRELHVPRGRTVRRGGSRSSVVVWLAYLLPAILLLSIFYVYPVGLFLAQSVWDGRLTLAHYARMFSELTYVRVLYTTFRIGSVSTVIALLLAYPLAYVIQGVRPSQRRLLLYLVVVPFWTSVLVRAYAWMVILGRQGLVNSTLMSLGIIDKPLTLVHNSMGVYVASVHILIPFLVLPILSVMLRIDRNLVRAARSLGATSSRAFWSVFLPLSLPGVVGATVLGFVLTIGFFIVPALLGGLGDIMIAVLIQTEVNTLLNWHFAAVLAMVLLVATMVLLFLFNRFVNLRQIWS